VLFDESPFLWRAPEFHAVERVYHNGPVRRFSTRTELVAIGERTRVHVTIELEPRSRLFAPLLPLIAWRGRQGLDRALNIAARDAAEDAPSGKRSNVVPSVPARFAPLVQAGFEPQLLSAFADFLEHAEDRDVARIRPYELAERLHADRRTVLRLCLAATRAGLLNLAWQVLCPSCRGSKSSISTLSALRSNVHCDACNLRFDPQFDRSVEVTFDAKPLGRRTEAPIFCIAGPRSSPHVVAQASIGAGGTAALAAPLRRGHYVANAIGHARLPFAADDGGAGDVRAQVRDDGITGIPATIARGDTRVVAENSLARDIVMRIEDAAWPDTIATAAQVTALSDFRDLFSSQVLAPGVEVAINALAVLFTDVVGSTAMYSRMGDAPAFRSVTDHFTAVEDVVRKHDGAVVKTIGDAVMAVFSDPAACFSAALQLNAAVSHLRCGDVPLVLRMGFHFGPCIAIRANERLDYFGTTVNLASRLQHRSGPAEITMLQTVAQMPAIAERLRELGITTKLERLELRGLADPLEVIRVPSPPQGTNVSSEKRGDERP
jgi:class 3 adenylate cyclase